MIRALCDEIHVGDEGTIFEITLYEECDVLAQGIDNLITMEVIFEKPDNTVVVKTASYKTDGTDSIIQYTTITGDLDQAGAWKIQARIQSATGLWSSTIGSFTVMGNLDT